MGNAITWTESPAVLTGGRGYALFGMEYSPHETPRGGVILCPPCFEERKSSHRPFVETARALAAGGWHVLRLDLTGCGESDGTFRDGSIGVWVCDMERAMAHSRKAAAEGPLVLLGLRLGAAISWLAACRSGGVDGLALWEPVVNGREYLEQELRKKLARDMMTTGRARVSRRDLFDSLERGEEVDFDGYPIVPSLYRELLQTDILSGPAPATRSVLVLEIGAASGPSQRAEAIQKRLAAEGRSCLLRNVYTQPFWNLVGLCDIGTVITETTSWLDRQWPQQPRDIVKH